MSNLIPAQLRAGRALIGWSRGELAAAGGVTENRVAVLEAGGSDPDAAVAVERALVQAGVRFLAQGDGGGAGVRLFSEPLMGWLQCEQSLAGEPLGVPERFATLWMLQRASDVALFSRIEEGREIFLISEAAARMSTMLPGAWTPADRPSLHAWSLLVGAGNAHERFGLRPPAAGPDR